MLAGSSYETCSQKGAAHLLSLGALIGNSSMSGISMVRELEAHGATFSSSADREKITYKVSYPREFPQAASIVANAVLQAPCHSYHVFFYT